VETTHDDVRLAVDAPSGGFIDAACFRVRLALLGRDGGERRYRLGHPLAAAVWAHHAALFEVRDVENLGKFFVAILAEKNVVRHGRFLLDPSSLPT
jgi:hypothetical protein